jgi:hypothetical protein
MKEWQPTPQQYFSHAMDINDSARLTIRLETQDATANQAKISIGLSLQAAELVGKGLLLLAGVSPVEIRKQHSNHKILDLLREAERQVMQSDDLRLRQAGNFLTWQPIIDGEKFGSTIGVYLTDHFAQGEKAFPRSYFYPDHEQFTGPKPIQGLYLMVEHMIKYAKKAAALVAVDAQQ